MSGSSRVRRGSGWLASAQAERLLQQWDRAFHSVDVSVFLPVACRAHAGIKGLGVRVGDDAEQSRAMLTRAGLGVFKQGVADAASQVRGQRVGLGWMGSSNQ